MMIIKNILLIGLGGGVGSILRYLISIFISKYIKNIFPFGTFIVNILGCLIIGVLIGLFTKQILTNNDLKLLFIIGFCGGFTTFSTFAVENINLLQSGNFIFAISYIILSILISIIAVWLGLLLTSSIPSIL